MEITSATFREVEFREKRHGYHPEDVDSFLEKMGVAADTLQDRLQSALERARLAEEAARGAGDGTGAGDDSARGSDSDETLRRTLVLAQRTADAAIREAREEADRLLSSAREEAAALVTAAEGEARQLHDGRLAEARAELARLEATRAEAQAEVDALSRWSEEHRAQLSAMLQEARALVDRAGPLAPPPSSRPIEGSAAPLDDVSDVDDATGTTSDAADDPDAPVPSATPDATAPADAPVEAGPDAPSAGGVGVPPASGEPLPSSTGWGSPATAGSSMLPPSGADLPESAHAAAVPVGDGPPTHNGGVAVPAGPAGGPAVSPLSPGESSAPGRPPWPEPEGAGREGHSVLTARSVGPSDRNLLTDPDEQALDDFFDGKDSGDDRRFGGRLRRKH